MTASVSVILPTYNRSESLKEACKSVLSQSYRDLELIVVDDASSEDIQAVIRALDDTRVRYIRHQINGGAAAARNTGVAAADGKFIAFQDSDDLWLPGKLARQIAQFNTLPEDVGVVTGSKIVYGRDASYNYGPGKATCAPAPAGRLHLDEDQVRCFLLGNRISLQNAVFRRGCFPGVDWFDPLAKANEDWEFAIRLVQHTRVYEDIEPVVVAFISSDSISRNFRGKCLGLIRILKKNRQILEKYPDIHAKLLIQLAQVMWRLSRKRIALRLIGAALRCHPMVSLNMMATKGFGLLKRLLRRRPAANVTET